MRPIAVARKLLDSRVRHLPEKTDTSDTVLGTGTLLHLVLESRKLVDAKDSFCLTVGGNHWLSPLNIVKNSLARLEASVPFRLSSFLGEQSLIV
jgi:hypothetical protein